MKWKGRARSSNVEDRRGSGGFGLGGKGALGGGLGILVLIVYLLFGGGDLGQILNQAQMMNPGDGGAYEQTAEEEELAEFVSVVLADTEYVWQNIFADPFYFRNLTRLEISSLGLSSGWELIPPKGIWALRT